MTTPAASMVALLFLPAMANALCAPANRADAACVGGEGHDSIGCPSIEKSCTAATYTDRTLGASEFREVSASTIQSFTGNNVTPLGDLAARSLIARIEVDRSDPENRTARHPDPIGWTEAHRGQILRALYTIMLGNPRADPGQPGGAQDAVQDLVEAGGLIP